MNKDKDLPLQEFKNFVNGPSNKNLFVLKENGKEYRAINDNNKSCLELQIDKGIIDNEEINKCDKGLIVLDDDKCILVELKGCDVSKACIQLNSTLDIFKKKLLKVNNYDYYCKQSFKQYSIIRKRQDRDLSSLIDIIISTNMHNTHNCNITR